MYERGFYKQLYLEYSHSIDQKEFDTLISLKGLVCIRGVGFSEFVPLSASNSLEELGFIGFDLMEDLKILPNHFTNLKRVCFWVASFKNLMQLISSAMRLDRIVVGEFYRNAINRAEDKSNVASVNKIVDLSALNESRQKLAKGRDLKVTIYIDEKTYLATKWAFKGNECGLIQLKRLEAGNEVFTL